MSILFIEMQKNGELISDKPREVFIEKRKQAN